MDVRPRLSADELELRLGLLGFDEQDAADLLAVALVIGSDPGAVARLNVLATELLEHFDDPTARIFTDEDAQHPLGRGVLPMLAMVATSDQVVARLGERGIPREICWASLADLGQQVWVNRWTYGGFGLHTQRWLQSAWAGRLFRLGRSQHELVRIEEADGARWVVSLHIPQTGPLTPASVSDSLERGKGFFAEHFPDRLPTEVRCSSWLLDPELAAGLPGSNIADFAERFSLTGAEEPGDADAVFFTWRRRGEVDPRVLPRRTGLERLVADRLIAGEHWRVCTGVVSDHG